MVKLRVRDLRTALLANRATWTVNPYLKDSDPLPVFATGGSPVGMEPAGTTQPIDFQQVMAMPQNNPHLRARHLERTVTTNLDAPPMGGTPAAIDWRNRWGWPWVTSVRNQGGCNSCWAFAATALVEAMVRVEHAVWTERSEGDVHNGMSAHCADLGSATAALDWIKANGIADPGCYPYNEADLAYTPTSDRPGRTVKIGDYTLVGSATDQKNWLDTVGPLVTWFEVWADFQAYGNGIYKKQNTIGATANLDKGGHFMLVVGYDDSKSCWIVKNSWNTGWGESGYGRIGYGECEIDKYAKIGLRGTNPDPLTKRRLHNGTMLESGNGTTHRNFELVATSGNQLRHWWRDNTAAGFPWAAATTFGAHDAMVCPTVIATTYNRNFELVYLTGAKRLHHWFYDQASSHWYDGGVFGPTDAWGVPGLIQANYGAPGNFELVVRTQDGRLSHWWRQNGAPWTWAESVRFGTNVAYSGPTLVQANYGKQGNFELVCVLTTGQMQHWWRANDNGMVWHQGVSFGNAIASPPCMIEASYGAGNEHKVGNFELCVAAGGQIQHWWRNNQGDMAWHQSATFGHNVATVTSLLQGSFGFNLELIALRTDGLLQHYWRDGGGWHEGVIIGPA